MTAHFEKPLLTWKPRYEFGNTTTNFENSLKLAYRFLLGHVSKFEVNFQVHNRVTKL